MDAQSEGVQLGPIGFRRARRGLLVWMHAERCEKGRDAREPDTRSVHAQDQVPVEREALRFVESAAGKVPGTATEEERLLGDPVGPEKRPLLVRRQAPAADLRSLLVDEDSVAIRRVHVRMFGEETADRMQRAWKQEVVGVEPRQDVALDPTKPEVDGLGLTFVGMTRERGSEAAQQGERPVRRAAILNEILEGRIALIEDAANGPCYEPLVVEARRHDREPKRDAARGRRSRGLGVCEWARRELSKHPDRMGADQLRGRRRQSAAQLRAQRPLSQPNLDPHLVEQPFGFLLGDAGGGDAFGHLLQDSTGARPVPTRAGVANPPQGSAVVAVEEVHQPRQVFFEHGAPLGSGEFLRRETVQLGGIGEFAALRHPRNTQLQKRGLEHALGVHDQVVEANDGGIRPADPGVDVLAPVPEAGSGFENQLPRQVREGPVRVVARRVAALRCFQEARVGEHGVPAVTEQIDGGIRVRTGKRMRLHRHRLGEQSSLIGAHADVELERRAESRPNAVGWHEADAEGLAENQGGEGIAAARIARQPDQHAPSEFSTGFQGRLNACLPSCPGLGVAANLACRERSVVPLTGPVG